MKTAEIVYNTRKKKGDKQYGVLFNNGKVRKRREWRGVKDTAFAFYKWLSTWVKMERRNALPGRHEGYDPLPLDGKLSCRASRN